MEPSELQRAVEAGKSVATSMGLRVDDAIVVNNSDRIAVRLIPCDVLARVAPEPHRAGAELEVEVARGLVETGSPVAELDPRVEPGVHVLDAFAVSLWTYYEAAASDLEPADYAHALARLHAGLRQIVVKAPHFTDRVAEAQNLLADRERTPELPDRDRRLLSNTLSYLSSAIRGRSIGEQLLHGEPHPGNLLRTRRGPLLIDLGTCCHGPVEFDIAHGLLPGDGRLLTAAEICENYPGANQDVVDLCHILIWAMVTTWRWNRDDQLPNGRYWGFEGLKQLRAAVDRYGLRV